MQFQDLFLTLQFVVIPLFSPFLCEHRMTIEIYTHCNVARENISMLGTISPRISLRDDACFRLIKLQTVFYHVTLKSPPLWLTCFTFICPFLLPSTGLSSNVRTRTHGFLRQARKLLRNELGCHSMVLWSRCSFRNQSLAMHRSRPGTCVLI